MAQKYKHTLGPVVLSVSFFVLLVFIVALIWAFSPATPEPPKASEKVRVGAVTADMSALIWIAQDEGFFKKHGVETDILDYASGVSALDALDDNKVDIAASADFAFAVKAFKDPDVRVFSSIATYNVYEIVARKDRGITKPADLKNKKIGVVFNSGPYLLLGTYLPLQGISLNDVMLVNLTPQQQIDALEKGEVDAVAVWEPNIYRIKERLGANSVATWGIQHDAYLHFTLSAKLSTINKKPEALRRFVAALVEAEKFVKDNEPAAKDILSRHVKSDPDYINYVWTKVRLSISLPQELVLTLEDGGRYAIARGLTTDKKIPNYLKYIHFDTLQHVKPEAVTIIR